MQFGLEDMHGPTHLSGSRSSTRFSPSQSEDTSIMFKDVEKLRITISS